MGMTAVGLIAAIRSVMIADAAAMQLQPIVETTAAADNFMEDFVEDSGSRDSHRVLFKHETQTETAESETRTGESETRTAEAESIRNDESTNSDTIHQVQIHTMQREPGRKNQTRDSLNFNHHDNVSTTDLISGAQSNASATNLGSGAPVAQSNTNNPPSNESHRDPASNESHRDPRTTESVSTESTSVLVTWLKNLGTIGRIGLCGAFAATLGIMYGIWYH